MTDATGCPFCASTLPPRRRAHCGAEPCRLAYNAKRMRELNARHLEQHGESLNAATKARLRGGRVGTVPCVVCVEPVTKRTAERSDEPMHRRCRERWARRTARWARAEAMLAAAALGTSSHGFIASGPCPVCGETFTGRGARYCSEPCRRRARDWRRERLNQGGGRFKVKLSVRRAIYERDRFTCQLCMGPVDMTLGPTDMWAATLDHIVPQSWVLFPDHSPKNLRLAHRKCNSMRGDARYYPAA